MPDFRDRKPRGGGRGGGMSRGGRGGQGARGGFSDRGGRGRGRGGRGRRGRDAKRSIFPNSRLEETQHDDSDEEDNRAGNNPEDTASNDEDNLSELSAESEDERPSGIVPYNALLQSFRSITRDSEPRQKRRKLDVSSTELARDEPVQLTSDQEEPSKEAAIDMESDEDDHAREPENDLEDDIQSSDDESSSDPFDLHFANPDEHELATKISAVEGKTWTSQKLPSHGDYKITGSYPGNSRPRSVPKKGSLTEKDLNSKQRLQEAGRKFLNKSTLLEATLVPIIFDNQDLLFGDRTPDNAEALRKIFLLHALNHLYKTRDRIIKNNDKLARDKTNDLELRDQGFTRPKILILTATRAACYKIVQTMLAIAASEQQENKKRFEEAFLAGSPVPPDRPADYRELFEGNDDDEFRVGIKFTRKTVKYFSKFSNSDIILASPLGLFRSLTSSSSSSSKLAPQDTDFLSSIELTLVDQADALLMQNWEHVSHIFTHLNTLPRNPAGTDFSRVRSWCLNAQSAFLRQTVVLSSYITPALSNLFTNHMRNVSGRVKVAPASYPGQLASVVPLKQTFTRISADTALAVPDKRFAHFTAAILPSLARAKEGGVLLLVPSSFDFIRVRRFFSTSPAAANISFGCISEYSDSKEAQRTRSHFSIGRIRVLVYSVRAHHFQRYKIRGVREVVWYGVPDNALFYGEALDMLASSVERGDLRTGEGRVRVVFTKWDGLGLERVVGSERLGKMMREGQGDVFEFV